MSTSIRKVPTGKSKYIQGSFPSAKNDVSFPYKSSYELAYLQKLENNTKVVQYIYEPFDLYYTDMYSKQRVYKPDFMVLYEDGSILISEVKPQDMLKDFDVQAKAKACKQFIKDNYKDIDISYEFVTEKDLFKDATAYTNFIKNVKR